MHRRGPPASVQRLPGALGKRFERSHASHLTTCSAAPRCWGTGGTQDVRMARRSRHDDVRRGRSTAGSRRSSRVARAAGDLGVRDRAAGAVRTCTATPSSAGWRGWRNGAGRDADSFWTWREVMYRFLDRMGPDDVEAIAALAYAEMLEGGFTTGGRVPLPAPRSGWSALRRHPAEMAGRIAAAAAMPPASGSTLLPSFLRPGRVAARAPAGARASAGSSTTLDGFAATLFEASRRGAAGVAGRRQHGDRAAQPARGDARAA